MFGARTWDQGDLLGSFLGAIAANFRNFPICYERWPLVPDTYKDNVYREPIQKKFDVNDGKHKEYILKNIGKKWKDDRCKLFNKYYDFDKSRSQNLESCPEGILLDHWASFIDYRMKDKTLAICDKNAANRQKQMVPHTLRSKSMARKQHELEVTNKQTYIRSQMYPISHKKNDGSYVSDEAREKSQLAILEKERASSQHSSHDDAFSKLFRNEHLGRVRDVGFGVCPTQVFHSVASHCEGTFSCSHGSYSAKIQQMEAELKENKAVVSVFQAQLSYFITHYLGGTVPSDFPIVGENKVEDLESPGPARRPSSSASHDPENDGLSNN